MKKRVLYTFCYVLLSVNILFSQTFIDLTTGVQDGTTNLIATGSNDDTWMVKAPGTGTSFVNIKCMDGFLNSNPISQWPQIVGAKWITPSINTNNQAQTVMPGVWQYRMIFTTTCGSIKNAVMTLQNMGADNMVNRIELNGTIIGNYNATSTTMVTNQTINIPIANGTNTLIVFTTNNPWQGTTINLHGQGYC